MEHIVNEVNYVTVDELIARVQKLSESKEQRQGALPPTSSSDVAATESGKSEATKVVAAGSSGTTRWQRRHLQSCQEGARASGHPETGRTRRELSASSARNRAT